MSRILILAVLVVAAACASPAPEPATQPEPAAAATLDPVGAYTFSTTVQGMAVDGQLRINGSPGSWTGSMYSDVTGELPLSSVRVEGQQMRLTASTPDGPVQILMVFEGDEFTGNWSLGADGGTLRGRRVRR